MGDSPNNTFDGMSKIMIGSFVVLFNPIHSCFCILTTRMTPLQIHAQLKQANAVEEQDCWHVTMGLMIPKVRTITSCAEHNLIVKPPMLHPM